MSVMKVTKKPVEVEALYFTGENHDECKEFVGDKWSINEAGVPVIQTMEGDHEVIPGAMIVKGVAGEFYPVDPAVIEETYEVPADATVESLGIGLEKHWDKEERDAAPAEDWAMPERKKLRIDNEKHVRLAWSMVSRVKGASDSEIAEARKRILARARKLGMNTKEWTKGKAAMESVLTGDMDRVFVLDAIPYLLNQLSEESGELVQAAAKSIRFGINSVDPNNGMTGRDKVREEYTDVRVLVHLLDEELISRGYDSIMAAAGDVYFQERLRKRLASLKQEYADGRFTLPGEFADQQ